MTCAAVILMLTDGGAGQPATSLGGVESLIEQRVHSDPGADPRLIRISVGAEDLEVRALYAAERPLSSADASPRISRTT